MLSAVTRGLAGKAGERKFDVLNGMFFIGSPSLWVRIVGGFVTSQSMAWW